MASKRAAPGHDSEKPAKRPREHASSKPRKSAASGIDPTYGQRGVFGNLQDATTVPAGDSDLDCEDDAEAMAYLRSVRTQAFSIPHVVAVKKAGPPPPPQIPSVAKGPGHTGEAETEEPADRSIYRDGTGDFRGYYHDGAYTAYPEDYFVEEEDEEGENYEENEAYSPESSEDGPHNSSADEIRDAYFTSLINQYLSLRQFLQTEPPEEVVRSLPASNPIEVEQFRAGSSTFARWSGRLRGTDPLPAQVAAMHKDSVVRLLRILLGDKFLRKNYELRERTSRWIWALLARLPEKGELDYQDIGWVRELGKRAVLLLVSLAEFEVLKENYDVGVGSSHGSPEEAEMDVNHGIDEELSQGTSKEDDDDDFDVSDTIGDATHNAEVTQNGNAAENLENTPKSCAPNGAQDIPESASRDETASQNVQNNSSLQASGTPEAKEPIKPPSLKAELEETSDVEMQLDSDAEEGEISDTSSPQPKPEPEPELAADIETAKARLLAQLAAANTTNGNDDDSNNNINRNNNNNTTNTDNNEDDEEVKKKEEGGGLGEEEAVVAPPDAMQEDEYAAEEEEYEADYGDEDEDEEAWRAKVNERAALNMILTVAGEFYGQRDLLEFRDPFGSF